MITSQKLYKVLTLDDYNNAKAKFINSLYSNYQAKSDVEKWGIIHQKFRELRTTDEAMRNKLIAFESERKHGDFNLFNLSLHDCLNYFENFYFLSANDDPKFKLSPAKKLLINESIQDAMGTCETGKNTRFEYVLQLYRTDNDWISNTLSKARYNLILRMKDKYCKLKKTPQSLEVHVLRIITQLAANDNYGVKIEHSIRDVHQNLIKENEIKQFYQSEAPARFAFEYEDEILNILTQHLLDEIRDRFFTHEDWQNNNVHLENDKSIELSEFLKNHLGDSISVYDLCLDEEEDKSYYSLKKLDELKSVLLQSVKQKLETEEYTVPYHQFIKENKAKLTNIRLKGDIAIDQVIALNTALSEYGNNFGNDKMLPKLIQTHEKVILLYPELFLTHLKQKPALIHVLSKSLKNYPTLIEGITRIYDEKLQQAINKDNQDEIIQIVSDYLLLEKYYPNLYEKLSDTVKNNSKVQKVLNSDNQFIKANTEDIIRVLSTQETISINQAIRLASKLKPCKMLEVINNRSYRLLKPLPYFNDNNNINHFITSLKEKNINFSTDGIDYIQAKKQAFEFICFGSDTVSGGLCSAATFLGKTENWVLAMMQYAKYQKSGFENLKQLNLVLKELINSLLKLIKTILKIAVSIALTIAAIALFQYIQMLLPPSLILVCSILYLVGCALLRRLPPNRSLSTLLAVFTIIFAIIFAGDVVIVMASLMYNIVYLSIALQSITEIFSSFYTILSKSIMTILPNPLPTESMAFNLEDKCENIILQLNTSENRSAQEKGEILEQLLHHIKHDLASTSKETDRSFTKEEIESIYAKSIQKPYTITYHDKEYTVSFQQVAAMSRDKKASFEIKEEKSVKHFGFFKTTSEKMLPTQRELEQIQVPAVLAAA